MQTLFFVKSIYLNMSDHLQQILPYKYSHVRQQCCCTLHSRHSHGSLCYIHWYLQQKLYFLQVTLKSWHRSGKTLKQLSQFTWTWATISSKSFLTSTVMPTNSVGAFCIHVTVMVAGDAFIDILIAKELFNLCYKVNENGLILNERSSSVLLF